MLKYKVIAPNLRDKRQLRRKKLADSHQLEHTPGVVQLDRVVSEPAGDVALPVEDAHCHHRPHQHRAVTECRPCPVRRHLLWDSTWIQPGQKREESPHNGVGGQQTAYGEVSLYCHLEDSQWLYPEFCAILFFVTLINSSSGQGSPLYMISGLT